MPQTSVHLCKGFEDSARLVTNQFIVRVVLETFDCKANALGALPNSINVPCWGKRHTQRSPKDDRRKW